MIKWKRLYTTKINDYKRDNKDVEFSVDGLFDTHKIHWIYFAVSHQGSEMTTDICSYGAPNTIDNINRYAKKFNTKEEAIAFLLDFKDKWEYSSNDTRLEKRDKKIDEILDK